MLILPAILESFRSLKDRTIKVTFETSELEPNQVSELAVNLNQFGYVAFKRDEFKQSEIDVLNSLKSEYKDEGKSKGQRLRGVLYRLYEQDPLGYKVFDDYYNYRMEELINHFKGKIL